MEDSLNAEKQKTAEAEKNIGLEAGRITEANAKLGKIKEELKKLEAQIPAKEKELAAKQRVKAELVKQTGELDAKIREELIRLGILEKQ